MTKKQFERGIVLAVLFAVATFFAVEMKAQVNVAPAPFVKPQFFNGSLPCNGCKLYSYATGTTTPLATYTDSTGGSVNANPVILDSNGYGSIWLGPTGYKLILKTSADVTIWTVNGIKSFSGPQSFSDSSTSGTVLQITNTGASSTGIHLSPGVSASYGLSIDALSPIGINVNNSAGGSQAIVALNSGNASLGILSFNTGTGSTIGIESDVFSATGISGLFKSRGGGKMLSGTDSANIEQFSVSGIGAIVGKSLAINGGTAITAQTGTGGTVVMSASPTLTGTVTAAQIALLASVSVSTGTSAIAAGTCATTVTTAFSGALSSDVIMASPNSDIGSEWQKGLTVFWYPTANNVNVRVCNPTAGSLTPNALTWNVRVVH